MAVSDTVDSLPRGRTFSVSRVLKKLGVSTSGYYDWKKRKPSSQQKRREKIKSRLLELFNEYNSIYGAPKLTILLRKEGYRISERTVTKYMRELGIRACFVKHYTVTTISVDFTDKLRNILKRDFNPSSPNTVWCTDITYVWTDEGFMYLSCIMDLFSRKIVAWELSRTLETTAVVNAVRKALFNCKGVRPTIIHTDRGVQYTSDAYREATEGIKKSYSGKGDPWDNACIESFHALIKREWLNRFHFKSYGHAYRLIFEYIDTFYNTRRMHSHCGYMSPLSYELEYYRNIYQAAS